MLEDLRLLLTRNVNVTGNFRSPAISLLGSNEEIVTGEISHPYDGCRAVRVPEECPKKVAQLIKDCMQQDPSNRPSADQIVTRLESWARMY
ncbi:hypothetical protein WJX73_001729 [Symbiochloris irregularis]|uniref:Serine-threonine/tyrosine-protein kinase catalytic domain-containing protein n=1 Tax=Symbiochloris irregularis TaxID=706552 RepID=A0AAW1Q1F9_9CHLO